MAGEEVDMPLLFFIDKDVLDDPQCRDLDDVVLSYTFFKCVCFTGLDSPTILSTNRARRTERGDLVPDADEEIVLKSQGFDKYEHAPRVEARVETSEKKLV